MEYCAGKNLRELIDEQQTWSIVDHKTKKNYIK